MRQFKSLVLGMFLLLLPISPVRCVNLCSNCTADHIRRVNAVTGKCTSCWPCSHLECHEGTGSSVACGTTVTEDTAIHCVACVRGANFSDSSGSGQCQPCGVCAGKHERVLLDCTPESDVKCECESGFYRNRTTTECQPCASCCAVNGNIEERCKDDEGEIETKCKFKELWPSICLSSSTSTVHVSVSVLKHHSSVLAASSSLMMSSFLQATSATPLVESITATAPVSVDVKATLASVSGHGRQTVTIGEVPPKEKKSNQKLEVHLSKTVIILISVIAAGLFVCGAACCIFKCCRMWHAFNSHRALQMEFSHLEAATCMENKGRKSIEGSGVSEPLLGGGHPDGRTSSRLTNDEAACKTVDSSNLSEDGLSVNLMDGKLEKGIPLSLDNGARSQGQRQLKRLPSEGDDKSESCLEGHQPHCSPGDYQDESVSVEVDKMSVLYHHPSSTVALSNDRQASPSSSGNVVSTHLDFVSSSNAEQSSGFSPISSEEGIRGANQGAICTLPAELPIQSTEDNRGYFTHIKDAPETLIRDLCIQLDSERPADGKDYIMFASELKVEPLRIRHLKEQRKQSGESPSYVLLTQVFAAMENSGTLAHLCSVFKRMGRYDLTKVIDDWVSKNP